MMKNLYRILICFFAVALASGGYARASSFDIEAKQAEKSVASEVSSTEGVVDELDSNALSSEEPLGADNDAHSQDGDFSVSEIINDHLADSYSWHITTYKGKHIEFHLPVIVHSKETGWHIFMSGKLSHGDSYNGFYIAQDGKYKGKIVTHNNDGKLYRPWDISITKNALALMINSIIMIVIFLSVARWYRRKDEYAVPRGFVGAMEMFVMDIEDNVIRKNIGKDYKRYSPYLLTAFFFIFINNVMGLIPIFPGGANTTGNIAITLSLAVFTAIAVNVFGNREYWKEILWPDVPWWLKVPIPLMPIIEIFGALAKPFALMIRLLANILAGHTLILALTFLIFVTVKMGVGVNAGMTVFSVILSIFMNMLEVLVAYIQAYVFTILSSIFIGMSRPDHHGHKESSKAKSEDKVITE